jgi:tetratricopeptide (TPR) repeat protein
MWRSTARMLLANRWTGVGAGAWEVHIPLYQNSDQGYEDDYFAHNEYLQLLAEYGLPVGGLAIAFLLAYLLQSAGRTWHVQAQYESEGPLRWTALVSLLALALVCLAGFPLHLAATGALLALCLALLGGSDVRLGSPQLGIVSARAGPIVRSAALVLLICASLLAAGISVQAMRAERLLVQVVQRGNGILASGLPASAAPNQDRLRLMALQVRAGVAIAPHYRKLSALGADQLAKWGDWETAAWVWRSVLASRPWLAAMWANLARAELQLGDYPAAYSALQQWLALQPGSGDANALLVDLLERMGRAEGALRE